MNDGNHQGRASIDAIARDIVDRDPSNGAVRPGKIGSTRSVLRRPKTWVGLLVLAAIGIGLAVALGGHSSPGTARGFSSYVCHGTQQTLFDNVNADSVASGGLRPTFSTRGKPYCLMYVQTYHWNKGKGSPPGTVGLVRLSGPVPLPKRIASLAAKASAGQGGVANVNWYASVSITKPVILDGTYSCADSDPATWSANKASGGDGFCIVYGNLAIPGG